MLYCSNNRFALKFSAKDFIQSSNQDVNMDEDIDIIFFQMYIKKFTCTPTDYLLSCIKNFYRCAIEEACKQQHEALVKFVRNHVNKVLADTQNFS